MPLVRTHQTSIVRTLVALAALTVLAFTSPPVRGVTASAPQGADDDRWAEALLRLMATQAVAGYEEAARELISAHLPSSIQPRLDDIGNLVVQLGAGAPHRVIVAPLDEPGFVISAITPSGYARLHRVSGRGGNVLYDQYHHGQPVQIRTRDGRLLPAVTATSSVHLLGATTRRRLATPRRLDDLWVDLGASSEAEVRALGVRELDSVVHRRRGQRLAGGLVAGPDAAARAAALALLGLTHAVDVARLEGTLTLVWQAQSSFGARGLRRLARELTPDAVLLLGGARGGVEGAGDAARGAVGTLHAGPVVSPGLVGQGSSPRQGVAAVGGWAPRELAWGAPRRDAAGVPVRYAETPVETVAIGDVRALARLLGEWAGPAAVDVDASALPRAAPVDRTTLSGSFALLRELIETHGVSGHEGPVRERIRAALPAWAEPEVDAAGNLTVGFGAAGGAHLLFVAHMDEVGYETTAIHADGSLSVRKRGGFLDALYEAQLAVVVTPAGPVHALLTPRPGYLAAERGRHDASEARVDLGTESAAATRALGVEEGQPVTIVKRFEQLAGTRGTGRAVDDRNGSTALVEALRRLDPAALPHRVTFAWAVREEVGLEGASELARRLRPDVAIAVDTFVSSDSPVDAPRLGSVPLGAGVVARGLDGASITPLPHLSRLLHLAASAGIPVAVGTTGGGTDASAFTTFGGVPMPISWPSRYSHSPVELMDRRDLEHLIDLIVVLARSY